MKTLGNLWPRYHGHIAAIVAILGKVPRRVLRVYDVVIMGRGCQMLKINDDQIKQLESDLKTFAARAFPFSVKSVLNSAAFDSRKIAQDFIKGRFIERNTFTRRSVQVDQVKGLTVRRMASVVGSIADYMEDQEFGTVNVKKGKHGVPIPTSAAAGQKGAKVRTKLVKRPNRMASIKLRGVSARAKTRRQKNRILVQQAAQAGGRNRFIFLDLGRRAGIYKVTGGKRKPKLTKMWDLSKGAVVIPSTPWLLPSVNLARAALPRRYLKALQFQAKRAGLFR